MRRPVKRRTPRSTRNQVSSGLALDFIFCGTTDGENGTPDGESGTPDGKVVPLMVDGTPDGEFIFLNQPCSPCSRVLRSN